MAMNYAGGTPGFYAPGGLGRMSPEDKNNYFPGSSFGRQRIQPPSKRKSSYEPYTPKADYYYGKGNSLNDYLFGDNKSNRPNFKTRQPQQQQIITHQEYNIRTDPVGGNIPISNRKPKETNQYGDPKDRVYAGGSPSFNEKTGRYQDYTGADGTVTRAKPQSQRQGRMAGDIFNRDFQPGPARGNDVRDIRGTNDPRNNKGGMQNGIGDFMRNQFKNTKPVFL